MRQRVAEFEEDAANRDSLMAVRVEIASMDKPEDLYDVITEIQTQLHKLGVEHDSCTIQIVNEDATDFFSTPRLYLNSFWDMVIHHSVISWSKRSKNAEDYPWVIEVWKTGTPHYDPCTTEQTNMVPGWSVIDVPFSHGTLAINRRQPNAFDEKDIAFLQLLGQVLSEGFQRFIDIVERNQAEEALRESEERLRSMYSAMSEGVCLHEILYDQSDNAVDYRILDVNPAYESILGIPINQALGSLASELYGSEEPPYLDIYAKVVASGEPALFEAHFAPMDKYLNISAFSPGEGRFVTVFSDITERRRLEDELRRAHNLESLGLLAGGIAHDFNNVLTGVTANLDLLAMFLDQDSKEYELASAAIKSAERTRDFTQQLMTFSRGGAPVKETVSIQELIRDTANLSLSGSRTKPAYHFQEDLSAVDIDREQMAQVIQNLVLNADQSMLEGGVLKISARNIELSERDPLPLESGTYVKVSIEDQGTGMSEDVMTKTFDPYYSTKQAGRGLGLSIVYSIISRHGGHIRVCSEIDAGTTFDFYLPASEKQVAEVVEQRKELPVGTGRILLMDDEELIHQAMTRMLEALGYK